MHGSTGNITLEGRTHPFVAGNSEEKVQMPPIPRTAAELGGRSFIRPLRPRAGLRLGGD
jgi:hypothetical protein